MVLVKKGLVTVRDIRNALQEQKTSNNLLPLGAILLQKELVNEKQLEAEVRQHILRVFKDMMGWKEGVFYFHHEDVADSPGMFHGVLSIDFLLLESSRLGDERHEQDSQEVKVELWT